MRVNTYQLLTDILYDSQGNVGNQVDAVYDLFLKDVLDIDGVVYLEESDVEFTAIHKGILGKGSTPSEAIAKLIKNLRIYS